MYKAYVLSTLVLVGMGIAFLLLMFQLEQVNREIVKSMVNSVQVLVVTNR